MRLSSPAVRRWSAAAIALASLVVWHAAADAKSALTVTLPQGAVLAAGPDFATDVLKDAWDFSNPEDLSPDTGETNNWCTAADVANSALPICFGKTAFNVSNGLAGGTAKNDDATLGLLFTGYSNVVNMAKTGLTLPIDTSKYKKLAIRSSADLAGNDPQVFWFPVPWYDPADAAVAPSFDRNFGEMVASKTVVGYKTFLLDLSGTQLTGPKWTSAPMRGFRLDPNNTPGGAGLASGAGHNFFYDWVRLTCADADPCAAKQTIQWSSGSGTTTVDIYDANGSTFIVNAGSAASGVTSLSWNYGVLPPGSYTVKVSRTDGSTGTQTFRINTPPAITITAPSRTSGEDYATTVQGNAWDMSDQSDVQVIGVENFTPTNPLDLTTVPGTLTGTNTNNDPAVTLVTNTNNGNGSRSIDTSKYRYLTYRFSIDGPVDIGNGSVARWHWASGVMPTNFTTTRDILVFAGMQSYTIDLATLTSSPIAPFGGLEPSSGTCSQSGTCTQEPWTTNRKTQLRFDPHEFGTNPGDPMPTRAFHLDDVKLTAKPVAVGSYTIKFTASDADTGDTLSVNLFRTTDTLGSNKVAIASNLTAASGQFVWDTTSVPQGEYYVYAEITDGRNLVGSYSDAPVVVAAPMRNMALDAPGGGTTVSEPFTTSGWAIESSSNGPGVDAIHVWAFPSDGSAAVFLGAANYFQPRSDVASIYGSQYVNCGYQLQVNSLNPGTYTVVAYAHSSASGTFTQSTAAVVTVSPRQPQPAMSIDGPAANAVLGPLFSVGGWAIDRAAPSGSGVDAVHIYAIDGAGAATFLGVATSGLSRSDVGGVYGAQFTPSGYALNTTTRLPPGAYTLVVYARSTVSGSFFAQARPITVRAGDPYMSIDTPVGGASVGQPFAIAGWALDRDAASGSGVDAIHVWAFPASGASPIFVGTGQLNLARNDVGGAFGAQFNNSGYSASASGVPAGQYQIVVYAHSSVTGNFNQSRAVSVTVR